MSQTSTHFVVDDENAEAIWFIGTLATIKASDALTSGVMAAVEFTIPPGFATPEHVHHTADEVFYIIQGKMVGYCGDQTWTAGAGSFVWLPRGIPHGYAVEGDDVLRVLTITIPAGFDHFVTEAGEPAAARVLPPQMTPDTAAFDATAAKFGITHLGPPRR